MEETELDLREITCQEFIYVPENKYTVVSEDEDIPDLVTSHVNDCVVVTMHDGDGSYGMAHVNREDSIDRFLSITKSETIEQMLDDLPEGQYEANIVNKGRPSETAFHSAENSVLNSSKVKDGSYNIVMPDYPSELNPELKPFRNPIRNSIEVGFTSEGEVFIPGTHPTLEYDEEEIEKTNQGPGISDDYIV